MSKNHPLIQAYNLCKDFKQGGETLSILRNLGMTIEEGEMVALVGPSGAGKSTLLHLVGLLDTPTSGSITLKGEDVSALDDKARTELRRQEIGFIYQFHHLQPEFSALENVMVPQMIAGMSKKDARDHAAALLSGLGLADRLEHRPSRLSGGEQQRVSIARALINKPSLILADEPTGNLDPETSEQVFDMLVKTVRQTGVGALIATHNLDLADRMDRVLEMKMGQVSAL
ncbi:MAG: ABC transporter ATP-binding protein [Alphaproteobacteria bacterium]|jgi:lipoprotein-releasing system ATP-binding protein|nr:ABC transporter ATP-binding protein [Alphaproteobacteria bacterium]MDP7222739.1 ABC transporter ATP-binding protein [Alphaproteobacteria bacterium]